MSPSPLAYLIGILVALPVWILVGVLAVMTARLFLQWLTGDGSAPIPPGKNKASGKRTLKG